MISLVFCFVFDKLYVLNQQTSLNNEEERRSRIRFIIFLFIFALQAIWMYQSISISSSYFSCQINSNHLPYRTRAVCCQLFQNCIQQSKNIDRITTTKTMKQEINYYNFQHIKIYIYCPMYDKTLNTSRYSINEQMNCLSQKSGSLLGVKCWDKIFN